MALLIGTVALGGGTLAVAAATSPASSYANADTVWVGLTQAERKQVCQPTYADAKFTRFKALSHEAVWNSSDAVNMIERRCTSLAQDAQKAISKPEPERPKTVKPKPVKPKVDPKYAAGPSTGSEWSKKWPDPDTAFEKLTKSERATVCYMKKVDGKWQAWAKRGDHTAFGADSWNQLADAYGAPYGYYKPYYEEITALCEKDFNVTYDEPSSNFGGSGGGSGLTSDQCFEVYNSAMANDIDNGAAGQSATGYADSLNRHLREYNACLENASD